MLKNWNELCSLLAEKFGTEADLNSVLFLIGMRERGLTFQPFSKEEKMNLIHLGSCVLYPEMGLTENIGTDRDGWPLFVQRTVAADIPEERKHKVLQDCALRYFNRVFQL